MSSKFRDGFLRLLHCKSLVKNRLVSGARKGTFHTTSTNLSSSQSGDKRKSSRYRDDIEYFDKSIRSRRSLDHSVEDTSKIRIMETNTNVNGNTNSYFKDVIRELDEEHSVVEQNDDTKFIYNKSTQPNPKLQRLCNKSTSFDSDDYKPNIVDNSQTKYNNGHSRTDAPPTESSFKNDSTAMLPRIDDNVDDIESPPNNFANESDQSNDENICNKNQHQHHDSVHNGVRDEYNEYQSFLCRKRDLESLV